MKQGVELSLNNNNISSCYDKNGSIRKTLGRLYSTAPNQTAVKTILLIFLSSFFFLPSAVFALDFDGQLKGITITDPASGNTPPTAVINYRVISEDPYTVQLDASGSSDPDGSITEYQWYFGDGSTLTGATVTHEYVDYGNYPTSLTVIDDKGGVAIKQILIIAGTPPFAYFKLDGAGGFDSDQIFDEISQTWIGSGASNMDFEPGFDGNCVKAAQRADAILLPASLVTNQEVFTLEFDVNYTDISQAGVLFPVSFNKLGYANTLFFNSSYSINGPRVFFSKNYSSIYTYFDTKFEPTNGTWVNYKIIVNFQNSSIEILYNNESMGILANQGITAWGDVSGDFRIAFHDSPTATSFSVDNIKIYHSEVR